MLKKNISTEFMFSKFKLMKKWTHNNYWKCFFPPYSV